MRTAIPGCTYCCGQGEPVRLGEQCPECKSLRDAETGNMKAPDFVDEYNPTEAERVRQGGMGYMQTHAAITWIRTLLAEGNVANIEHGNPADVRGHQWEISAPVPVEGSHLRDPDAETEDITVWITYDQGSFGHLLISFDREAWTGMGVTYHPPTNKTWNDRVLHRIRGAHKFPDNYKFQE
jgi:hypothetical protein